MIYKLNIFIILIFAICTFIGAQTNPNDELQQILARLDDQSKAFAAASYKITPSVVNVSVIKKAKPGLSIPQDPTDDFFNDEFFRRFFPERPQQSPQDREQRGLGSGVIVSANGVIISNNHVVKDADEITVKLADKRVLVAKLIGTDEKTDIAVLKIEANNLPAAQLGNSDQVAVGQWVLAVGNPFGLTQTITAGIISAKGRNGVGIIDYEDFIQTDAAINPGNSGGPLVNLRGEVIGINTAIASRTGGNLGIGFAVPINMAKNVAEQLLKTGKVRRGWLGVTIQEITPELIENLQLTTGQGAIVSDVMPGSPAEVAGIKQDDVILAYEGNTIDSPNRLRNLVAATPIGKKVRLEILRDNRHYTVEVTIGDLDRIGVENSESFPDEVPSQGLLSDFGLEIKEITPALIREYQLRIRSGVVITHVKPGSTADRYNIVEGTIITRINQMVIRSLNDVATALQKDPRRLQLLLITRNGYQAFNLPRGK